MTKPVCRYDEPRHLPDTCMTFSATPAAAALPVTHYTRHIERHIHYNRFHTHSVLMMGTDGPASLHQSRRDLGRGLADVVQFILIAAG